jgi:hypothetical protein
VLIGVPKKGVAVMPDESVFKSYPLRTFGLLFLGILACSACGYKVRSSMAKLPSEAQSLGIPTLRNLTTHYRVEQLISRAVLKEFAMRTRAKVNSSSSGVDLVLLGDIRDVNSVPVTFGTQTSGTQTFGSTFLVTVRLSVILKRLQDSAIIWQNEDFLFSERYVMNSNLSDFFLEENPALERLARDLSASLASSVLSRSTP